MVVLRLKRLGSYNGYGIKATANDPLVQVDEEIARKLLATGYFSVEGSDSGEIPEYIGEAELPPGDKPPEKLDGGSLEDARTEPEKEAEATEEDIPKPVPPAKKKGGK